MSLDFIPSVWAARLLSNLDKTLVYGQPIVCSRDYEGDISQAGSSVKIASIGDVTIGTYSRNEEIGEPNLLTDDEQTILIDRARYFNFYVDSIDRAQQNVNMLDEAMKRSAWALRADADEYIANLLKDAVPTGNTIGTVGTPVVPTKANAYEHLVDLSVLLDEANAPIDGRYVVVPAWFHGLLLKDDRFITSGMHGFESSLANGEVGRAAGFTILKSNNVPHTANQKFRIVAGHAIATAYVDQVLDVQAYKPEKRFGDAVKGLHVYGAKVVKPQALACLIADKPS